MKELPKSERPYEKLELYGEKTLSNAELLAIIIKTGTKDETSVELAQRILKLNDTDTEDLSYLQALSIEELMQIKGIGKVKAIQLKAVTEIAIRMFKTSNYKAITIKQPHDLAKILMSELKFEKSEKVKIIVLNNKNEIFDMVGNVEKKALKDLAEMSFEWVYSAEGEDAEEKFHEFVYGTITNGLFRRLLETSADCYIRFASEETEMGKDPEQKQLRRNKLETVHSAYCRKDTVVMEVALEEYYRLLTENVKKERGFEK